MNCSRRKGTGEVDNLQFGWRALGDACKEARMNPFMGIYEVSLFTGISIPELYRMECGLDDPAPLAKFWGIQ